MQAARRRAALLSLAATAGAFVAMPELASADLLAPDSTASDGAGSARTLYVIMAVLAVLIVIGVLGAIARALRTSSTAAEGDEGARRTRGTGSVQVRVGAGLGVLALILFVVGIIFTGKATEVEASANDPITIQVDAQQWVWRYEYPVPDPAADGFNDAQPYSYQELVVPVDTPINLEISSIDVLHRWSVPSLALAADAVPGHRQRRLVHRDRDGHLRGIVRPLLRARLRDDANPRRSSSSRIEYEAFLKERVAGIKAARAAVQERVQNGTAPGVKFEK